MQHIIEYCKLIYPISKKFEEALLESINIKILQSGDFFLKPGMVANYACLVTTGFLRSYYLKDEEEITTKFLAPDAVVTSIYSFYTRQPTNEFITAITETELECFHYNKLQDLLNRFPEFNVIVRKITEQYLVFSEIEIFNLRKQSAEERYRFFLKHHSQILQVAPLKYIASYLSMNLETLSRVRSKVRQ
ncbi:MAG: Crp/Fnr family transcriptional regulator [Chitinophaga sp.]|jgi:CRP/FNR family transcriptional regulator, anaerobic regulatory protein|nr:Crp/Fnr family transcriptional regulator [Chitinophaga sp.]